MYLRKLTIFIWTLATVTLLWLPGSTFAATGDDSKTPGDSQKPGEEMIITGTSKARASAITPFSATEIDEEQLAIHTYNSQADILRLVPGVKAEGGGGEVATNVFIRGLPSGGQFQFTPLLYDGMPAFSTFGLNSSAFDVYYRNDLGVGQMEFVRGGVTNLFGPGSVAGVINYISKTGTETPETQLQVEGADESRYRFDFTNSGPLDEAAGLYYALSGYYRYDEGPLDTGFPTEGGQVRGNIRNEFADGSGSITFYGQAINDRVQFFLPFPLDGQTRSRTPGNNGDNVKTVQTSEVNNLNYQTPDGTFNTPIRKGVLTKGGSLGIVLDKDLGNGWGINSRLHYAKYAHEFNLFLDGDGIVNTPETQAGFLANRANLAGATGAEFTYAKSGQMLQPGELLFANRLLDRNRPARDFSAELNVTKTLNIGYFEHDFTAGTFFARSEADDDDVITTYLAEFNNRPKLVNLTVVDTTGAIAGGNPGDTVTVSNNGLLNPGVIFSNNTIEARRLAGYLADQMESDRWVIDVGVRVEQMVGDINREGTQNFTVEQVAEQNMNLATDLKTIKFGDGSFTKGRVRDTAWAGSLGALFKFTDELNFYGNASVGFFFPQLRSVKFDPSGEPASYNAETITQIEIGAKYAGDRFSGTLAPFYTKLQDRANVDFVNDPNNPGGTIETTSFQDTETFGVEVTGSVLITDWLTFDGNFTYADNELTTDQSNPAFEGNRLRRQPKWLSNYGLYLNINDFDAAFFGNYVGENFANDGNTVKLDSFSIWGLDAGYTFRFSDDSKLRFSVSVFNLFDDDGVTEGSPRQGSAQSGTGAFFVGRPILPQRVTARMNFSF